MNTVDLKRKWGSLVQTESLKGYKSAIMSSQCEAEIYLGVNSLSNHCLILALPKSYGLDFNIIKKEKISITLYSQPNLLVLELHDNLYHDIFDDLIISLYQAIKNIKEVDSYTKKIIQTFNKWSNFFEDESNYSLSKDEVKGLFGELYVLKTMIDESTSSNVDEILKSWKGPYDKTIDFIFDDKNIEVKTKSPTKQVVNISSEHQLEIENNKLLELLVLSVIEDIPNGDSLKELLAKIKVLIINKSGDFSIILKALKQKNITQKNIIQYDNYRFSALSQDVYDCNNEEFPKLVKTNTPESISEIRYKIDLSSLGSFMISTRTFDE